VTTPNPKSAESHFLVFVAGIDTPFATKTGGAVSGDVTRVYDGGAPEADLIPGRRNVDNIVVGRPYARGRDQAIINELTPRVLRERRAITVIPTDADLIADPSRAITYASCLLMRVTPPAVNAAGTDGAMWEMEWSAPRVPTPAV
jgi:hypothetical protein